MELILQKTRELMKDIFLQTVYRASLVIVCIWAEIIEDRKSAILLAIRNLEKAVTKLVIQAEAARSNY